MPTRPGKLRCAASEPAARASRARNRPRTRDETFARRGRVARPDRSARAGWAARQEPQAGRETEHHVERRAHDQGKGPDSEEEAAQVDGDGCRHEGDEDAGDVDPLTRPDGMIFRLCGHFCNRRDFRAEFPAGRPLGQEAGDPGTRVSGGSSGWSGAGGPFRHSSHRTSAWFPASRQDGCAHARACHRFRHRQRPAGAPPASGHVHARARGRRNQEDWPILGSVPARSRAMLARWRQ